MDYVAVFDIGTTAIKGLLVNRAVEPLGEQTIELTTYIEDGNVEQQPEDWWEAIKKIAATWWQSGISPHSIRAITFSGQMEDLITVSKTEKKYRAILYSDTRAGEEAGEVMGKFPDLRNVTGNNMSATTPLAKISWLQKHRKEQYKDAKKFVFCAKDFIIYKLTGVAVTDPVTGATTGMMDLTKRKWHEPIVDGCGVDISKLPNLIDVKEIVGTVSKTASKVSGFSSSTFIINGSGDAGASTLGAGSIQVKDGYFYLGTTGWLAMVEKNDTNENLSEGHFNLAFVQEDQRISVAPLLNVGNVHNWAVHSFCEETENSYVAFESLIETVAPGSEGVVFLPYLYGERNPIHDPDAKGAYWGVSSSTTKKHLARAALEGVTFSLKQTLEMFEVEDKRTITLIGGGSKSETWCQMMADIMNHPIRVPLNSEYLPSIGIASSAFLALGWMESYEQFIDQHVKTVPSKHYYPNEANVQKYESQYTLFKRLYPALRTMYQ
ncbi:FGGY-family carbohydrate kinase [Pseudogracilibacillus auburnensis]|uniref:Xylulokinase n=1 Tax=Pseudogracilibacillus auburnensis TaxID=1494959 RepID=A0A2V3WAL1_9BACI|nr:FGGY family carbohydrate kinase [Pseudogracilibacillus auburnensis]MBO1001960.1 hypothetical protein [Pseudogracilibacillus auburnensis]PXW90184.1 xylulokinase [Pseudogracilibacillus auburnensis]